MISESVAAAINLAQQMDHAPQQPWDRGNVNNRSHWDGSRYSGQNGR